MPNIRPYRGKRIDNGEWTYGYAQFSRDKSLAWICESKEDDWTVKNQFPVDPETVGQYTGIKKTYEGDLLPPISGLNEHSIVCYDIKQACYKCVPLRMYHANAGGGGWTGIGLKWHFPDPVGNRWDNPNLLEVGQ